MFSDFSILLLFGIVTFVLVLIIFLSKTSVFYIIGKWWRCFEDQFHVYQSYRVPQFNDQFQENQLYRKIYSYLNSLPSVEDSDNTNLFAGSKSGDIFLRLDGNQTVQDSFLGARVFWKNENRAFVLSLRKNDKRRILRPYLQQILSVANEIDENSKEIKLFLNLKNDENPRWLSVPFTHPATIDTVVMDGELKQKLKSDLESFLKSKQFYHRLGRVWKRSYLLYGSSGTGKSSFISAMARVLNYDVYDIDIGRISTDSDLKMLLLQTTNRSLILIEDLDRILAEKLRQVSLPAILNFMDGIISCCGEERVMVFTMNSKDQIDESILRPGRIDVHIQFPPCDFSAFKNLASGYLGVKDHKLFPQLEENFQRGTSMSPAEIAEIMISNRSSPTRALKSVITALQSSGGVSQRLNASRSVRSVDDHHQSVDHSGVFGRENVHPVTELGKLYGFLRMGSRRKTESMDLNQTEKESLRIMP